MKQGKLATVAFLNELPEMQHDTSSFQVDVSRAEVIIVWLMLLSTVMVLS